MASKKQKNIRQLLVSKKIVLAFTLILTNVSLSLPEIAHAITYDSLQNEYFDTIEDYIGAGTENVGIRFGTTLQESLRFNRTTNMFETSKGVEVHGTMSGESLNVLGSVGIGTTPVNAKLHIKNGGSGQKFRIETNASLYSAYLGGGMNGAQDEFGINFGASLAAHLADTSSTAWGIEASGTNDYFAIRRGSNNGQGNAVTWTQQFRISNTGNVSIGLGSVNAETKLEVGGTISGTTLTVSNLLASQSATSGTVLVSRTSGTPEWKLPKSTLVWYVDGDLATGTSQSSIVTMPFGFTVTDIDLKVKTAPTTQAIIVDINEGGSTIYSTRPEISAGSTTEAGTESLSDTELAAGSEISLDIDQVGSGTAGNGLTVMLHGYRHY